MENTTAREIAANLRCGQGHYVRLEFLDRNAKRIYRIKRSRTGEVSVYLGLGKGWTTPTPGTVIYSDRENYTV